MLNSGDTVGFEEAVAFVIVSRTLMKAITVYLENSPFPVTAD
jgi:hypothetical protein